MNRAIVTFGTGKHKELLDIAFPTFKAFADKHNWDIYCCGDIGTARPAPWYKLKAILSLLPDYDEVLWLGADLVIVDGREDLTAPSDAWQAMVNHHTNDGEVPNTEVWLCRKPMIPILEKAWTLTAWLMHGWWEQAAIMELMGYVGYGSRQPAYLEKETKLYRNTYFLDNSWNVHTWDRPQPVSYKIQHSTMYPDRMATMNEWALEAEGWMNEPVYQPAN